MARTPILGKMLSPLLSRRSAGTHAPKAAAQGPRGLVIPEADREILRLMARESAHLEIGGRAMRERSDFQTGGDVVGRTVWVGKAEWASGERMTPAQILAAVNKAIAGQRLGHAQERIVMAMLDELAETRGNILPQPVTRGDVDDIPF